MLKVFIKYILLPLFVASVPAFIVYYLQAEDANISIRVEEKVSVINSIEQVSGLAITYNDFPVDSLAITTLKISNSGNKSIKAKDFESNLTVCTVGSDILSAQIIKTEPNDLDKEFLTTKQCIELVPQLLNPSDSIYIKIFHQKEYSEILAKGRITDVKSIEVIEGWYLEPQVPYYGTAILLILCSLLYQVLMLEVDETTEGASFSNKAWVTILILAGSCNLVGYYAVLPQYSDNTVATTYMIAVFGYLLIRTIIILKNRYQQPKKIA